MPFVPKDFSVPREFKTSHITIRKLLISDAKTDYAVVMESRPELEAQNVFGPENIWPSPDLTLEQNMADLSWHSKEFELRRSFAYAVMDSREEQYLGCAYIYPTSIKGYDAEAYCWVKSSAKAAGYDKLLYKAVSMWLKHEWPFENVAFPGRALAGNSIGQRLDMS